MAPLFHDRAEAGASLAEFVAELGLDDPVVLALPRGGVPVAAPVARRLSAPLDLLMVRKLGMPGHAELAAGAVVEGAGPVFNREILAGAGLSETDFRDAVEEKRAEMAARRARYLGGRVPVPVAGRDVVVVDDGIATGATMRAALKGLRARGAWYCDACCARSAAGRGGRSGPARRPHDLLGPAAPLPCR